MPRTEYENQLQAIQDELLQIGSLVESSITKALDALKSRDLQGLSTGGGRTTTRSTPGIWRLKSNASTYWLFSNQWVAICGLW